MLAVNSFDPCFVSHQALQAAVEKQMELVETVEALQHRPSRVRVSHSREFLCRLVDANLPDVIFGETECTILNF